MKIFFTFLTGSVLLFQGAGLLAGQTNTSNIDLIKSDNFGARFQAVESLDKERQDRITVLISILDGNALPDIKDSAAKLLGDYRAAEAVDSLVRNFALDIRGKRIEGILADDYVEAVTVALIRIGNPSIPAVIRTLGESDESRVRDLSLKVLNQIEGDKDIVQLRLQKALKAEKDPQKQARLQSALKMLGELK